MSFPSMLSSLAGLLGNMTKKSLSSHCFLETSDGEETLVAKDGSLATVIRIDGTRQMMGDIELAKFVEFGTTKLSSFMSRPGHAMQVWFCRDPDLSSQMLRTMLATPRSVADDLKLDLDDLFMERERHLPKYIVHEAFYIVLWTRLAVLSKQERQRLKLSQKEPAFWPKALDTQGPFLAARQMTTRHRAFCTSLVEDLSTFGIRSRILGTHDALRAIKASIYPEMTGALWKPRLIGDVNKGRNGAPGTAWTRRAEMGPGDMSHLLWPRLDDQLFDRGAEVRNQHMVRIGRYLFTGVDMSIGPSDMAPFNELLNKLRVDEFPWRVSFLMEGDGLSSFAVKAFLAGVAQFTNSDNRTVKESIQGLNLFRQQGGVVPRMRVAFATWTPEDQPSLAEERGSRLQKAVEGWGFCLVSPTAGDPLAGAMSSALGLDVASTATPGVMPLGDALNMMPWMRDASPFDSGSVLFRTIDGRPWPYQPGSNLQNTYIDIVYAPPGNGKSVWLNTTNLAFCLSPLATRGEGGSKLPLVSIIDIGDSSSGLISLIKESLPADRRHEASYKRLRMVREHAINPFDTQLGCRGPLPHEKAFLVNFVTLLGTDPNEKSTPRGMSDLADRAIDEIYERFSDKSRGSQPKLYVENEDNEVDEAMRKHSVAFNEFTTWWDVTDALFDKGLRHEASMAQRHAVPLVEDLIQVVNTPQIIDIFGDATIEGGERLIKSFQRLLSSCLRAYPILNSPTRFDIAGARVISLDLQEAAPSSGGGPAEKQTALVYMLARFIIARDFYLVEDNLKDMPEEYRGFHRGRITRIRETPKRIVFDEFHRTASSQMVRDQVVRDMREGRKWGVQVALASQLLTDFDASMLSLATGFWIMGVNQEQDIARAKEMFGLSETATASIPRYLNGPTRHGAPFLAVLQMKDGRHEHLLYNTLGPMELWAFSTTTEDVGLRNRLYARLGATEARRRLATRFPKGSAKEHILRRLAEINETGVFRKDDAADGAIKELAEEMIAQK
jgi:intracellular multiplication protein IcmB